MYRVAQTVGPIAMTVEDGEKVFEFIHEKLRSGKKAELDFAGVEIFASPFFNAAVGQLLKDVPLDELKRLLVLKNLNSNGASLLNRVIENARQYYLDPASREAVDNILKAHANG